MIKESKQFLDLLPPWKLLEILSAVARLETEKVALAEAQGRVAAEDILVPEDYPPFDRATMDGYAVRSQDVQVASSASPVLLELVGEVIMGQGYSGRVGPGQAVAVPTGGMMPRGADSVVMVEQSALVADGLVELYRAAPQGANVLHRGEDAAAGDVFVPAGRRLGPAMVGALSGMGILEVSVGRRPRVGVLATGDEIVEPESIPGPGRIRDVNGAALCAASARLGALVRWGGIVPDDIDALTDAVGGLLEDCDLLLLSGGSSVGVRDLTEEVFRRLGGEMLFHGAALKPGRPTLAALVDHKLVMGMPGHPVSSAVSFSLLVAPVLAHLEGETLGLDRVDSETWPDWRFWPRRVRALLGRRVASVAGREHFVRVRLEPAQPGDGGTMPLAWPLPGDSAVLSSLVLADGLVRIAAGIEGLEADREVEVLLL